MDFSNQLPDQLRAARLSGSACDTCRRRRVKCNGTQPCERCVKSGLSCTFGSSANRTSATSYARHLEQKVAELQALLDQRSDLGLGGFRNEFRMISPADSLAGSQEALYSRPYEFTSQRVARIPVIKGDGLAYQLTNCDCNTLSANSSKLCSLLESRVGLDQFSNEKQTAQFGQTLVDVFDAKATAPLLEWRATQHAALPPKEHAHRLTDYAIKKALICYGCLSPVDFSERLDDLYDIDPEDYSSKNKQFLALVYGLLALARRVAPSTEADIIDETSDEITVKGLSYYHTSCDLLNQTDHHNLDSIVAIICQARYLISISLISRAYSVICVGVGAALRISSLPGSFSDEELWQRRRVFSTMYMLETLFASILGIPRILKDAEKQPSLKLKEECETEIAHALDWNDTTMSMMEALACQNLSGILGKIIEDKHSIQKMPVSTSGGTHREDFESVTKRETELRQWHNELLAFTGSKHDTRTIHAQLVMLLYYAEAQLTLYKPYLHYLTRDPHDTKFNMRGYECGSACVHAAMQGVWVAEAFQKHNMLHEAYWLIIYLLGLSGTILTFFVMCSAQRTTLEESTIAARKATNLLGSLAKYSIPARRFHLWLQPLVDALPC